MVGPTVDCREEPAAARAAFRGFSWERILSGRREREPWENASEEAALTDLELLGRLLAGPRRADCSEAGKLLESIGGLPGLLQVDAEIARAQGLSDAQAASVLAAAELARRLFPRPSRQSLLESPERAARYLFLRHARTSQEVFGALHFGARGRCVGEAVYFRGTLAACTVSMLPILVEAVRRNAESVVLFHNHPSGNPTPSDLDFALTAKAKRACEAIGVALADHLIFGREGSVSLRREKPSLFAAVAPPASPEKQAPKNRSRVPATRAAEKI